MTNENRPARMLLGAWANVPARTKVLEQERAWALAQRDRAEDEEGRQAWTELSASVERELAQCARLRQAVDEVLGAMEPAYRDVVHLRYEKGMHYAAIARATHYSVDHVRHIKSNADRAVAKALLTDAPKSDS